MVRRCVFRITLCHLPSLPYDQYSTGNRPEQAPLEQEFWNKSKVTVACYTTQFSKTCYNHLGYHSWLLFELIST